MTAKGHRVRVHNGGVSGDTSAGGLARLDWAVGREAQAVIVELGANDMLRGLSPKVTEKNLRQNHRKTASARACDAGRHAGCAQFGAELAGQLSIIFIRALPNNMGWCFIRFSWMV